MTAPLERVLRAFLADPVDRRYGYDLMKAAGLKSGTLYPLLGRLEEEKLVTSAWETPQQDGQRPRKYYRLTADGAEVTRLELAQVSDPGVAGHSLGGDRVGRGHGGCPAGRSPRGRRASPRSAGRAGYAAPGCPPVITNVSRCLTWRVSLPGKRSCATGAAAVTSDRQCRTSISAGMPPLAGYRLLTRDVRRYLAYFPTIEIIAPALAEDETAG
jgi:DNA-binding PadR family transcriptional regulator